MTATTTIGLRIEVLGTLRAERDGTEAELGGPKQRAVLAMIVSEATGSIGRDRIIEGVWGEEASDENRHAFYTYLSNLRRILGDVIVRKGETYSLAVEPDNIDHLWFIAAVDEARHVLATDPGTAAMTLRVALGLWRGRPYADLVEFPGLESEVRRLEELRLEAVELRVEAELAAGLHGPLVAELEALAEEHPLRERFRAQHMLALYRTGRQADALRAYRRTESFLAEELGIEPSEELRDLELKILEHDDSLLVGPGRAVTQRLGFLVTDIEGSTRLWDRHPRAMATALATHDGVLRRAIEEAGGRLFKHTGDGVLAAFPDSVSATEAAETAQRSLEASEWGEVGTLRVRMGIDVGEVEARGGDYFGPPLNRAARLCAIGHGGQVLVSAAAQTEVVASAPPGVQIRQLGEYQLRGMANTERVAQLVFVGLQADFLDLRIGAEPALDGRAEILSLPGYEVRDRLGEGAFGVVWRAYQPSVGREVAVKMIRPELASQPSFVRRFEAEARTIARVAHPHIVPLIDFFRDTTSAYLVLALLSGGSLATALASGTLDRAAARRILGQLGAALDHAHALGMAHGDVKPSNVLLDGAGNAYLSDFGIAARLFHPEVISSVSSDAAYRAPEETEKSPSPAGDLYALGVLARELLGDASEIEPIVAKATAFASDDRYRSSAAFLADLDEVLGEEPVGVVRPVVSRNPYKGLRAFEEGDAADFYGRGELVATLVTAVAEHRFVTVVGPSGSGKSSAVRAGLLPALAGAAIDGSDKWFRIVITPGTDPMAALAEGLMTVASGVVTTESLSESGLRAAVDGELVVVIDQFEELYTLADAPQREAFVRVIADAVGDPESDVRVVVVLRADFYDRPLEDRRLGKLVRDGLVTVLPSTHEELTEMITAPAHTVGLRWEPGLPHRIADDVSDQAGALPLLQYALTELVERRSGDLLTSGDYKNIGGVAGALANRAEAVFTQLSPRQRRAARQILLRLVVVDEDSDDTRRRVRRSELESIGIPRADLDGVLDTLTAQRLLLADRDPATRGPTVEVAHEALLREWPRLRGWIDDQRDALILGRRFRVALSEWESNDRHSDYLLTGSRLAPFAGWAETRPEETGIALTGPEIEYLEASTHQRDLEEANHRRRRRRLVVGLAAISVLLASVAGFAVAEADRANGNAALATARELALNSRAIADDDPELGILLALESIAATDAVEAEPLPESLSALWHSFARHRVEVTIPGAGYIVSAFSPDGTVLATDIESDRSAVVFWDPLTGDEVGRLSGPDLPGLDPDVSRRGSVSDIVFDEDLVYVARSWPADFQLDLVPVVVAYDVDRLEEVMSFLGPPGEYALGPEGMDVSERGDVSAFLGLEGPAVVWPADEPGNPVVLEQDAFEFLGDGSLVLGLRDRADPTSPLVVVDWQAGTELHELDIPPFIGTLALSPDRTRVATSGLEEDLFGVFDVETGAAVFPPRSYPDPQEVSWSEDGTRIALSGNVADVTIIDAETGEIDLVLSGHNASVFSTAWHPSGEKLASIAFDNEDTRIWDVTADGPGSRGFIAVRGFGVLDVLDRNGRLLYNVFGIGADLIDPETAHVDSFDLDIGFPNLAVVSEDGSLVAGRDQTGAGVIVDVESGETTPLHECALPRGISSDGTYVVVESVCASEEFSAGVINLVTGEHIIDLGEKSVLLADFTQRVGAKNQEHVALVVGSLFVASQQDPGELQLWALDPLEQVFSLEHAQIGNLFLFPRFSDDGRYLGIGTNGGRGAVIDIEIALSGSAADDYIVFNREGHSGNAPRAVPSVNGLVATAGLEGFYRIWNIETGELVMEIDVRGEQTPVSSLGWSPDGSTLYYLHDSRVIGRLPIDPAEMIELAASAVTRSLTDDECRQYLHTDGCS